jgi:hypothetical protein
MKIALILAIVIGFLAIPALAAPENITTGPYKVSFDMGLANGTYDLNVSDPKKTESLSGNESTSYEMEISSGIESAHISITEYKDKRGPLSAELREELLGLTAASAGMKDINTAKRTIDGVTGVIASGIVPSGFIDIKAYVATYNPSFDPRHIEVLLYSNYPWDEGTLALLKTIHIEKVR